MIRNLKTILTWRMMAVSEVLVMFLLIQLSSGVGSFVIPDQSMGSSNAMRVTIPDEQEDLDEFVRALKRHYSCPDRVFSTKEASSWKD
jgi:hypothetical protein